ncbi:NblA/ycf18 family protein [Alkalinema sp. FACHB-956]|uniref:NblA/ycf18 family protein n=1 Tax=Alkalinema sp. FACHB-956 TaxID=2692768 RepID=UPI001682780C|nr:NblA/ycf18 family protein [Alkalinema sp. FACHB-956]MBD2325617.1 NblA/ycf18 family protein [Alkalinema sp. FACHB-956]
MDKSIELTLEQQFNLRSFATLVRDMSREQAQEFLVNLYEQMLIKDAYYKHFLRKEWGLEEQGWEGSS